MCRQYEINSRNRRRAASPVRVLELEIYTRLYPRYTTILLSLCNVSQQKRNYTFPAN